MRILHALPYERRDAPEADARGQKGIVRKTIPTRRPAGTRRTRGRTTWALLIVLVVALAGSIVGLSLRSIGGPTRPVSVAAIGGFQGRVASVSTGTSSLAVRVSGGTVEAVSLSKNRPLITNDGRTLTTSNVRPGDAVQVSATQVRDVSQTTTSLRGIVALAPSPDDDSMILQMSPGRQILVNLESDTLIDGTARSPVSLAFVVEAEQVQVNGILDDQLEEMTQTDRVLRATTPS